MDAFEVLHQMHEEAKSTFQKIEQAPDGDRAGLWAKLRPELTLHEQIEERFIYEPVAKDARGRNPALEAWDQQHNQQVRQAEGLMGRIGDLDPKTVP